MRRFRKTFTTAVLTTPLVGGTAGWVSASGESPQSGPRPGSAAWPADDSLGREHQDPATAIAPDVAAFFAGLTGAQQQQHLVEDHPTVVGNLDGVPVHLRHAAKAPAGDRFAFAAVADGDL